MNSSLFEKMKQFYSLLPRICEARISSNPTSWTEANPTSNHCAVVSMLAQDIFGGEIVTTTFERKPGVLEHHYFNILPNGQKVDFTNNQFPKNTEFTPPRDSENEELIKFSREFIGRKEHGIYAESANMRELLDNAPNGKFVSVHMRYEMLKTNFNKLPPDLKPGLEVNSQARTI